MLVSERFGAKTLIFTRALAFCLPPLLLAACGGGGGGALDVTAPDISGIVIAPQSLSFSGGEIQITAQVTDDRDVPGALSVQAELILASNSESVVGPVALIPISPSAFSGALAAPANGSLTGVAQNYFAQVTATDSSANSAVVEGGTLTIEPMEPPPPPPPL